MVGKCQLLRRSDTTIAPPGTSYALVGLEVKDLTGPVYLDDVAMRLYIFDFVEQSLVAP